jgi:hypothetical protein
VALGAPLNYRQLEVLRWISDGCPDGRWNDFSYKTMANALEWRGLVAVSKRGGVWTASILPAGQSPWLTPNQVRTALHLSAKYELQAFLTVKDGQQDKDEARDAEARATPEKAVHPGNATGRAGGADATGQQP